MCELVFDDSEYVTETLIIDGEELKFRAFENIPYVTNPADAELQRINLFVPEAYYEGKCIGKYSINNAPIFMPNTVGGYMPGKLTRPGVDWQGKANTIFKALLHGYVVAVAGVRGRGMTNEEGEYIGVAPAVVCDMKAAVRFLRHNADRIPGDVEKIITNGTSAGGALSSIMGATGNHPDYEPYLKAIGAANERDDIFAASCYCPITNLDNADMAYEWEFKHELNDMTDKQKAMSAELAKMFPAYLNSLELKTKTGQVLTLDADGNGLFKEYVKSFVIKSANRQQDKGEDLSGLAWLIWENDRIKDIDFDRYVAFRTRMKKTPAFDNIAMGTPENELFGTADIKERHFTSFSCENSECAGTMAEAQQIKMMNPMYYIRDDKAVKAKHYRIRHGAIDRDTSLAISAMLNAMLEEAGVDSELFYPWGVWHSGDYDLEELFEWIDGVCKKEN